MGNYREIYDIQCTTSHYFDQSFWFITVQHWTVIFKKTFGGEKEFFTLSLKITSSEMDIMLLRTSQISQSQFLSFSKFANMQLIEKCVHRATEFKAEDDL